MLRSDNSLKAVTLRVMINYRESTQIKISQGKEYQGQSPGNFQTQSFQLSCPYSHVHGVKSSQLLCVIICQVYNQPSMLTSAFGVQSFYRDSIPCHLHD